MHINVYTHMYTISKHSYISVHILICKCESFKYGHCGSLNANGPYIFSLYLVGPSGEGLGVVASLEEVFTMNRL